MGHQNDTLGTIFQEKSLQNRSERENREILEKPSKNLGFSRFFTVLKVSFLVFFSKDVFRKSMGTEFSSEIMIALLEKRKLDGKHGSRRAKEILKEAKNGTQGQRK